MLSTPTTKSTPALGRVILNHHADGYEFAAHRINPETVREFPLLQHELATARLKPEEIWMKFDNLNEVPKAMQGNFFQALANVQGGQRRQLVICKNGTPELFVAEVGLKDGKPAVLMQPQPLPGYVIGRAAALITVTKRPEKRKK